MTPVKASTNVGFVSERNNIIFEGLGLRKDVFHTAANDKDVLLKEIYTPSLRKYEKASSGLAFDHLDVVTTWRAISVKQGQELVFWRNAFERALGDQLLSYRIQGQYLSSPKKQNCKFKKVEMNQAYLICFEQMLTLRTQYLSSRRLTF